MRRSRIFGKLQQAVTVHTYTASSRVKFTVRESSGIRSNFPQARATASTRTSIEMLFLTGRNSDEQNHEDIKSCATKTESNDRPYDVAPEAPDAHITRS